MSWNILFAAAVAAYLMTPGALSAQLQSCPAGGADLILMVDNKTGSPQTVTFTGALLMPSCSGGATSFTGSATCNPGLTDCETVSGLATGLWTQQINAGLQRQATKGVVIANDPNGNPNTIAWTVFKTVLRVDRTDDVSSNPTPRCPSLPGTHTCTLRQAMLAGARAAAPLLVQFDPAIFPTGTPTTVRLSRTNSLPIAGSGMTIDGTDLNGDPTFRGDPFNRIVELPRSGATVVFSNQHAKLLGLFIQRPTLSNGATPGDIIRFDGTSGRTQQSAVVNCKIDGGGSVLTLKSTAHDCIAAVNRAGQSFANADTVENTEVMACPDKGVKATSRAYVTVRDSWLHNNIGGGIQATLSGNATADRNLIEHNGYNAAAQVSLEANGLAANGASSSTPTVPSVLQTNGNVIRNNSSRGISVQELSQATITNDLSCGATNNSTGGQNGIAIFNSTTTRATATVRGTAAVYNGRNGATVANQSTADFGGSSPNDGGNAFTQNATKSSLGGKNFSNASTQVGLMAIGNQWQHRCADPAHPAVLCDGNINLDVSGSVLFTPPQPYRADATTLPVQIRSIIPGKAMAGALLHLTGSGFNAIDGYPAGGNCTTTIQENNTCNPLVGNCVQVEIAPSVWVDLTVVSVTPTEIVAQLPANVSCAQPMSLRLQRLDDGGNIVSGSATFCTSS
jgi:hypothetical protein